MTDLTPPPHMSWCPDQTNTSADHTCTILCVQEFPGIGETGRVVLEGVPGDHCHLDVGGSWGTPGDAVWLLTTLTELMPKLVQGHEELWVEAGT